MIYIFDQWNRLIHVSHDSETCKDSVKEIANVNVPQKEIELIADNNGSIDVFGYGVLQFSYKNIHHSKNK